MDVDNLIFIVSDILVSLLPEFPYNRFVHRQKQVQIHGDVDRLGFASLPSGSKLFAVKM